MIKKIILGFIVFFLIFFVNYNFIKSYYYNFIGEYYFDKDDLEKSKSNFEKAESEASVYNLGNLYYKTGDFDLAIKNYESILLTSSKSLLFKVNHNLGNSYFRIGEIDIENSLDYFNMSASYYNEALKIYFNEETNNNYKFVLKKINELEDKKSENDESNSANKKTENPDKTYDFSKNLGNSDGNNQDSNNTETGLSNKQKEVIKEYQDMLKKEQNFNRDSYNKIYEGAGDYSVYENIYDNSLLENKIEKDW